MKGIGSMKATSVSLDQVKIHDKFWGGKIDLVRNKVLPYQWEVMNDRVPGVTPSHVIKNFQIAAGEEEGQFYGEVFVDSDLAKWLEAVACILSLEPDEELEKKADSAIDLIVKSQQEDGYINTFFTLAEPDKRFTNLRENHELYCAGHMIEAAVAYYETTGKRKLLDAICRFADLISQVFGKEEGQKRGYCGHPEIELALIKLYHATNEKRYLELSKYFIDERGRQPHWYEIESNLRGDTKEYRWEKLGLKYTQAHIPVREQATADGHAVRALYLLSGMTDLAYETNDANLFETCKKLWNNVTKRRMYITGAVGSDHYGERFTFDYDLPNNTAYAETCASVALVFWAHRMLKIGVDNQYSDIMEKVLYNTVLSGMSIDGTKYFYVNPLSVWPEACKNRNDLWHVKTTRQEWFSCACCPPNIARLIASLGKYIYSQAEDVAFIHLYLDNEAQLDIGGQKVKVVQETKYPWKETVRIKVLPAEATEFTLALRIPGWCKTPRLKVNDMVIEIPSIVKKGYAYVKRYWNKGDLIELILPMQPELIEANPKVREDIGKVAIQRGPLIYCLEEIDNGNNLSNIILPRDSKLTSKWEPDLLGGIVVIKTQAKRIDESSWKGDLYKPVASGIETEQIELTAIPYAMWCNRKSGEMLVWIREF